MRTHFSPLHVAPTRVRRNTVNNLGSFALAASVYTLRIAYCPTNESPLLLFPEPALSSSLDPRYCSIRGSGTKRSPDLESLTFMSRHRRVVAAAALSSGRNTRRARGAKSSSSLSIPAPLSLVSRLFSPPTSSLQGAGQAPTSRGEIRRRHAHGNAEGASERGPLPREFVYAQFIQAHPRSPGGEELANTRQQTFRGAGGDEIRVCATNCRRGGVPV